MTRRKPPEAPRPRIAFFEFTSCEGCQLQVLNLEEDLFPLVGRVEIVEFREAISSRSDAYDVAIVEGSVTRTSEIPRLQAIRERAGLLVALGACAHLAGVNALKNRFPMEDVRRAVYGESDLGADTIPARPLSAVVTVDATIPGCPVDRNELVRVLTRLLLGRSLEPADDPVCVECKLKENVCRFDLGEVCLGPVIRGGCDAICPTFGRPCDGCRGFVNDPRLGAHVEVLRRHGLTPEDLMRRYTLFTQAQLEPDGPPRRRKEGGPGA